MAHTAFNQAVFDVADVVGDTPVFTDYPSLYSSYPEAKFIFLTRPQADWLASIRQLLQSMRKQWAKDDSFFEADIKRCFLAVFPSFYSKRDYSDEYLLASYAKHEAAVRDFFADKATQFLTIDITHANAGQRLLHFCGGPQRGAAVELPHVNKGRRITYWATIEHENKIASK